MGYERNDRRYGISGERGGYGYDRERGYGREEGSRSDYGAYNGQGRRDQRGERFGDRDYGRSPTGYDYQDRGFFDRAGDEVRSWFGDDEAERRRREDERNDRRYRDDYRSDYYSGASGVGAGDHGANAYGRDYGSYGATGHGRDRGAQWNRDDRGQRGYDPSYSSWRDRQMQAFDRDYEDYRRENQSKFDTEFHSWRQTRQGQRDLLNQVQEHQEVVGSDGAHVGTVDHVRGDRIELTKSDTDAGGRHHTIPCAWVQSVDDKVTLSKTADQAKQHWRDEKREDGALFGGRDDNRGGARNLNRSFSGTY